MTATTSGIREGKAAPAAGGGAERRHRADLVVGAAVVVPVAVLAGAGLVRWTAIDLVVLVGVAVVLPLALGGGRRWLVAAGAAAVAASLPVGPAAAALVLPWLLVVGAATVDRLRWFVRRPGRRSVFDGADVATAAFAIVGAIGFALSRAGSGFAGIGEPIIELAAVHFTYAACGALALASCVGRDLVGRRRRAMVVATAVLTVGPIVVASGFIAVNAPFQIGGAVLMTAGVWVVAAVELVLAADRAHRARGRALLVASGLVVWPSMVLAVWWAAGQHLAVAAPSIATLVRTHGMANAVFVIAGLLAARRAAGATDTVADEPAAADRRADEVLLSRAR